MGVRGGMGEEEEEAEQGAGGGDIEMDSRDGDCGRQ